MKSAVWYYIGAAILFIFSICGIAWGGLMVLGSTAPNGQSDWVGSGAILLIVGVLMIAGGIFLIVIANRSNTQAAAQNMTVKLDLPGETKIEQMKCRSCGGSLTADSIKLVNGAPVVTCPYCNTVYQLTEEPKW
jgi:hypothetical protein